MKNKKTVLIWVSLLLLTACGSDSSSSSESLESQIKKKDFITIVHNVPSELCTLSEIKVNTNGRFLGGLATFVRNINKDTMISKFEQTNVNCEKYDRKFDTVVCGIVDWDEGTSKSCIIAFDFEN